MARTIRASLASLSFFILITGLAYPLLITGLAQGLFPWQANGSLMKSAGGSLDGSELIGQPFTQSEYFWGRLSATGDYPYNATASGGTQYSVLNEALDEQVKARIAQLKVADPENKAPIPVDLVTASASGLDPHISPAAAYYQVTRVARARGMREEDVRSLVASHIEQPVLGIFGEPRINVLRLNFALDSLLQ